VSAVPTAAVDAPPLDMTSAVGPQLIMQYSLAAVVAVMVIGAVVFWRRTGSPNGLLLLAGGLLCSMNEALVDLLGHCYFPKDFGIAYTAFGFSVPWWVVTAYVAYFGGLTWLNSEFMRGGPSRGKVWASIAGVWVLNLILEMPPLSNGVYQYYGEQPFEVGGFPLNWLVINALGSLVAAALVTRFHGWFTGPRRALLLLVPWSTYFASWVCHLPLFYALNSEVPSAVRWGAAVLSAVLGLLAMDALIRLALSRRPAPVAAPAQEPAAV
jgi:hypothetical protein